MGVGVSEGGSEWGVCECGGMVVGVSVCVGVSSSIHLNIAHNSHCVNMWHVLCVSVCCPQPQPRVYLFSCCPQPMCTSSLVPGGMAVECIHQ